MAYEDYLDNLLNKIQDSEIETEDSDDQETADSNSEITMSEDFEKIVEDTIGNTELLEDMEVTEDTENSKDMIRIEDIGSTEDIGNTENIEQVEDTVQIEELNTTDITADDTKYHDDLDFLREFDEEIMNDVDDEFMKNFERELDEEFAKAEASNGNPIVQSDEISVDNNIDISNKENEKFYEDLDNIVNEVKKTKEEIVSNDTEQEESSETNNNVEYSDDEIWRQFLSADDQDTDDMNFVEDQGDTDDVDFAQKEQRQNMEDLDIMELLNSIPDDESLSDIEELLRKDENKEPVVDEVLFEDIPLADVSDFNFEDDSIPVITPDSINSKDTKNTKNDKTDKEILKKGDGFLSKFLKRFKGSEEKGKGKSKASNSNVQDENSMILDEMRAVEEEYKETEGKPKNKKSKRIGKKDKKQKKLKVPKPPIVNEPEEPTKSLPKLPVVLICILSGSVLFLLLITTNLISYTNSMLNAKKHFQNQEYNEAYNNLIGLEIKDSDKKFFEQLRVIMELERQYSSYMNYQKLEMYPESFNSLLKGVSEYDSYLEEANDLGISSHFQKIMGDIESALLQNYNLSLDQARDLNSIDDNEVYTQQINSILQK